MQVLDRSALVCSLIVTLGASGCFDDPTIPGSNDDGDATGDGDGDGDPTGDGDGEPTGDGDGDPTGDGDGDPTGDGDGDGDPLGTYRWHLSFPGFPGGIAAHDGGLLVAGSLTATLELPFTTLVPDGSDVLLLGLTQGGDVEWARNLGGPAAESVMGLTTYNNTRFALSVLYWSGPTNYGGAELPAPTGMFAGAVVGFEDAGLHRWSMPLIGDTVARGLDVDGSNNVLVAGDFAGTMMADDMSLPMAADRQAFYLRLGTAGDNLDALNLRAYGGADDDDGSFVLLDGLGSIYYGGLFRGTLDVGGTPLVSAGGKDVFVMRINNGGTPSWAVRLGGSGDETTSNAVVDAAGNLVFGGGFTGSLDFEGESVGDAVGGTDVYAIRIRPDGTLDRSWVLDGPGNAMVRQVAVAANGDLAVAGEASGGLDLGQGQVPAVGLLDGFVVRYDADGEYRWGALLGSNADDRVNAVGFDLDSRLYAGLSHNANVELPGGELLENDTGVWLTSIVAFE